MDGLLTVNMSMSKFSTIEDIIMKPSNEQIDAALKGTGYSSKTKALTAYAKNADFPRFGRVKKLVDQLNVADADKVGFTLALCNIALNGCSLPGYPIDGGWNETYDQEYVNAVILQDVYSNKMRRKTIDKWTAAANAMNDYFACGA